MFTWYFTWPWPDKIWVCTWQKIPDKIGGFQVTGRKDLNKNSFDQNFLKVLLPTLYEKELIELTFDTNFV